MRLQEQFKQEKGYRPFDNPTTMCEYIQWLEEYVDANEAVKKIAVELARINAFESGWKARNAQATFPYEGKTLELNMASDLEAFKRGEPHDYDH